jgi:hypothetical protein
MLLPAFDAETVIAPIRATNKQRDNRISKRYTVLLCCMLILNIRNQNEGPQNQVISLVWKTNSIFRISTAKQVQESTNPSHW